MPSEKCKIKIKTKYHYTPVTMAKIQNADNISIYVYTYLSIHIYIFFFLKNYLFFIGGKLLYTFVQVSAIHIHPQIQHESVIIKYIYSLPPNSPSPASILTPLGHHRTAGLASCVIQQLPTILHMIVFTYQCYFLSSSHSHHPPLCPQVHSLLSLSVAFFQIPYICVKICVYSF